MSKPLARREQARIAGHAPTDIAVSHELHSPKFLGLKEL
jgi:hypothetical protein